MKKLLVGVVFVLLAAACGGDGFSITTVTTLAPAATTSAPTTSTQPATTTTTTVAEATTTTVAATTTTVPLPTFRFEMDGLGVVQFGDSPDSVIAVMVDMFGPATRDTGWVDEPLCPGPMNRFVDFGVELFDFQLLFTTGDLFAPAGTEHFFSYAYNGATPVPVTPPELTVGTKVSELQALYPAVTFEPNPFLIDVFDYHVAGPGAEGLSGHLSGTGAGDVVLTVKGGVGCGE